MEDAPAPTRAPDSQPQPTRAPVYVQRPRPALTYSAKDLTDGPLDSRVQATRAELAEAIA